MGCASTKEEMVKLKLLYFDISGRAEVIRLVLAQAGVEYEDHRVPYSDWFQLRPSTPWSSLPCLEVDDKTLGQSATIVRYLAEKYGLAGKTEWERLLCSSVSDCVLELQNKAFDLFNPMTPAEIKPQLSEDFFSRKLPLNIRNLEKFLENNTGNGKDGYFVGNEVTYADLRVYDIIEGVRMFNADVITQLLRECPRVASNHALVSQLPRIRAWVAKRPPNAPPQDPANLPPELLAKLKSGY